MRQLYLNSASAHAHAQRLSCAWLFVQSLLGFSVHGISQTRILQWVAIPLPGYLPNPGTELESSVSPALQAALYLLSRHTQVEEEGIAQKTSSEWLFSRVKLYGIWWSSSVQLFSCVWLFVTPWAAARQASLSITSTQSLLKLLSIKLVLSSNHLILCDPLLLLPSIFPSIRVFSNESLLCIRWPKFWSFSFSVSPSIKYSGLISFKIEWFDLLAVQGTLKSLLQHQSSKAPILYLSAFFMVQLSHPYMTTVKTIALTRRTFFGKVMSLLFNMLSRLVMAFLPRSKCLLISWLQSPFAVILGPQEIKSLTVSIVSPSISHEVMGLDAMILVFRMLSFKPAFSLSSFIFIKRLQFFTGEVRITKIVCFYFRNALQYQKCIKY